MLASDDSNSHGIVALPRIGNPGLLIKVGEVVYEVVAPTVHADAKQEQGEGQATTLMVVSS